MFTPLRYMLDKTITQGNLAIIDSEGSESRFGNGSGPPVVARIKDRIVERRLAMDPELTAGEAFMQGQLSMEVGNIYDFISTFMKNLGSMPYPGVARALEGLRYVKRAWDNRNSEHRAQDNVHRHYDIDPRIYDLFLDKDRQYSCAYFAQATSLDEAQLAKKRHIAAKLDLKPGHHVLDIGSGWGGLALYLAKTAGCEVSGITLSDEQIKISQRRAVDEGLSDRVRFEFKDYRRLQGRFDRIVSVGMFEHVGAPHYNAFFKIVERLLDERGVAVLHTIGRSDRPAATNPFIAKYIFPGGSIPSLSQILTAVERSGLIVSDVEILRLHYAQTLRTWRERFMARRDEAVAISGEDFARMWEFYLAGSEAAFRYQNLVVFQIQLIKQVDTLPLTRDYMAKTEASLAATDNPAAQEQPVRARSQGNGSGKPAPSSFGSDYPQHRH
jgi:cyclopropane-fatty-acyl-phospholipid synthase